LWVRETLTAVEEEARHLISCGVKQGNAQDSGLVEERKLLHRLVKISL
jgi:hypothetical protein